MRKIFVSLMALNLASMPICDCAAVDNARQTTDTTCTRHKAEPLSTKTENSNVGFAHKHGKKVAAIGAVAATAAAGYGAYKLKNHFNGATTDTADNSGASSVTSNINAVADSNIEDVAGSTDDEIGADGDVETGDDVETGEEADQPHKDCDPLNGECHCSVDNPCTWAATKAIFYRYIWTPFRDYCVKHVERAVAGAILIVGGLWVTWDETTDEQAEHTIVEITDVPIKAVVSFISDKYFAKKAIKESVDVFWEKVKEKLTSDPDQVAKFWDSIYSDKPLYLPETAIEELASQVDGLKDDITEQVNGIALPTMAGATALVKTRHPQTTRRLARRLVTAAMILSSAIFALAL